MKRLQLLAYRPCGDKEHTLTAIPPELRPVNLRTDLCFSKNRAAQGGYPAKRMKA